MDLTKFYFKTSKNEIKPGNVFTACYNDESGVVVINDAILEELIKQKIVYTEVETKITADDLLNSLLTQLKLTSVSKLYDYLKELHNVSEYAFNELLLSVSAKLLHDKEHDKEDYLWYYDISSIGICCCRVENYNSQYSTVFQTQDQLETALKLIYEIKQRL